MKEWSASWQLVDDRDLWLVLYYFASFPRILYEDIRLLEMRLNKMTFIHELLYMNLNTKPLWTAAHAALEGGSYFGCRSYAQCSFSLVQISMLVLSIVIGHK